MINNDNLKVTSLNILEKPGKILKLAENWLQGLLSKQK